MLPHLPTTSEKGSIVLNTILELKNLTLREC